LIKKNTFILGWTGKIKKTKIRTWTWKRKRIFKKK
jgi:hypothetical protein